jgi:peroxiredoxin
MMADQVTQKQQSGSRKSKALFSGTKAPDFTLHSTPDQFVSLSEFQAQPVVLAFYPAAWSPGKSQNIVKGIAQCQ